MQKPTFFPFVLLVATLHLGTMLIVNEGHTHFVSENGRSHQLASHDCGSKEQHTPLEVKHHCILCSRALDSFAYLFSRYAIPAPEVQSFRRVNPAHRCRVGHFQFESERGPPSLTS
ncbi:MAG: hypothetical protein HY562_07515 [Ignavibacteriales bacterium]|nr:hypothetical protein [Ignavibacteriales bacterium]